MSIEPKDRQTSKDDPIKDETSRPERGSQCETNHDSHGPADPHDDDRDQTSHEDDHKD
ncbi:hypothetical protein [Salinisphaera sp.]|uniref:hypothetical protein n=1 Tax=Salinisphaera sp. TaxID=1914330 RepID=UPI002D77CF43|nr:hypothetical protein [Salinisphaera sp.]HET7313068.1 hypothetical protein [Salinisphaera sp.]